MQNNKSVRGIFSASKHFLHFFVTYINFKIYRYQSYFLLLLAFFMTFSLLQFLSKKCYQSGHQRAPWLLSSRVMSIFAITSHQYTITLYTPGHLQISWDVFAKKSADILSFCNSFITISNQYQAQRNLTKVDFFQQCSRYSIVHNSFCQVN